jgi:hypothetical protein
MRRLIDRALWWIASHLDRVRVLTNQPSAEAQSWYAGLSDQPYDRPVYPMAHVPGQSDSEIVDRLLDETRKAA